MCKHMIVGIVVSDKTNECIDSSNVLMISCLYMKYTILKHCI